MRLRATFVSVVLPLSVLLNVFLITVLALPLLRGEPGRAPGGFSSGGPPWERLAALADNLPPADAAILRAIVAAERPLLDGAHASMRTIPERVRAALYANPFDAAALAAIFQEGAQTQAVTMGALERMLLGAATHLSPEGRRRLADSLPPPPGTRRPRPDGP